MDEVFVIADGILPKGWYFKHPKDASRVGPYHTKREAELGLSAVTNILGHDPSSQPGIPDFAMPEERKAWITANASYFTVIRRQGRIKIREEFKTLTEAEGRAIEMTHRSKAPHLIYAVYGPYDSWVKTVMP